MSRRVENVAVALGLLIVAAFGIRVVDAISQLIFGG